VSPIASTPVVLAAPADAGFSEPDQNPAVGSLSWGFTAPSQYQAPRRRHGSTEY
jgi:hypothetical protein